MNWHLGGYSSLAYNMNLGYSSSAGYPGYGQSSYGCLGYPTTVSSAFTTGSVTGSSSAASYGHHADPSLATYGISTSSLAAAAASSATCDVLSRWVFK